MTPEELREMINALGYECRSIRCFKKTFHVTFWTKNTKQTHCYRIPISQFTEQDLKNNIAGWEAKE